MTDFTVIFFREDEFYPIELLDPEICKRSLEQQAEDHALLNPGTLRIETLSGHVLWRLQ